MTICHIVASLDPRHGGPSKAVLALSRAQAGLGNRVELLASGPGARLEEEGSLTVRILRGGLPKALCPMPGLRSTLERISPDIVHVHGLWLRPLHTAHQFANKAGVPLVISPRGMMSPWAWRHHRWNKAFAERFVHPGAFQAASGWHATSAEEAQDIRDLGFIQPVCMAPLGVDVPADIDLAGARSQWNEICPATLTQRTALFYSRFHGKKRILELIDLWIELAPRDWMLLLVGIPEQYSVRQLRSYIYRSGGSDRIEVHDGAGRPAPYPAASLCLLPSHSENFGSVVAEALAAGIPALVTDSTPWKALASEDAGWCVPWKDYAGALREALAESPEQLKARGQRARAWAARAFSWSVGGRLLEAFYAGLRHARETAS